MTETPQGDPAQPTPPPAPQYPAPGEAYPPQQQYPAQQYPGQQYPAQQYPGQPASLQYGAPTGPTKTNGLALTALIVGIAALVLCWVPVLGLLLGIVAVILGILGMKKASDGGGKGLAIGGLATGALALLIGLFVTVTVLFLANAVDDNLNDVDWDELNEQLEEDLQDLENEG